MNPTIAAVTSGHSHLLEALARNWWTFALRGVCSILFGVMALSWPGLTIAVLIFMFAAYAIVDGIFEIAAALAGAAPKGRAWLFVLCGVLSIAAGLVTFSYPGLTALLLLYFIAFWCITHGLSEIIAAFHVRKVVRNEWLLVLTGLCSIVFGVILLAQPGKGIMALLWLIAIMSIFMGVMLIGLSLRLKGLKGSGHSATIATA